MKHDPRLKVKHNIRQLRDTISNTKEFDMSDPSYHPECNTAGCIIGYAKLIWPELRNISDVDKMKKLGITLQQYADIFTPERPAELCMLEDIPKSAALSMLDHLYETGRVSWPWQEDYKSCHQA